jgi:hypothetical protein
MAWMQYSCRQAAELISQWRDEPLSWWRRWSLRLHLKACGNCQQVAQQMAQLNDLSAALWRDDADEPLQR